MTIIIKTKNSTTTTTAPSSLAQGELAVNITDKKLWVGNAAGTPVQILGSGATNIAGGSNTQVQYNSSGALAGSSNLTFDGTALTLGGNPTLSGGTANGVLYLNGSKVATSGSSFVFDGTNLGVGVSSPAVKIQTNGSLAVGSGQNISWGGAYGAGIPTLAASSSGMDFYPAGSTSGLSMRLDSSGNLGLGVTPSAWQSTFRALQVGSGTVLYNNSSSNGTFLGSNFYWNGSNNIYIASTTATAYGQSSGQHQWYNAPSGTAGNAITFTQAMTLDASGNLGIGTSSPAVDGNGATYLTVNNSNGGMVNPSASQSGTSNLVGGLQFANTVLGVTDKRISAIYGYTDGATNSGSMRFFTWNAGTASERMRIDSSGRLLIGTTSASGSNYLQVNSDASINGLTVGQGKTAGVNGTAFGNGALGANTASNNTAVGYLAGANNTSGGVTAFGQAALNANTTGANNSSFGQNSLSSNTTGGANTAVGQSALASNTTASNNTAVGYQAGYSNTTGTQNTAVGYQAGYSNTTSSDNSFFGRVAGYSSTGTQNCFIGDAAGYYVTTGSKNTILGSYGGNQGGLDIRTASNYIVLSDGDGNPRLVSDGSGNITIGTASLITAGDKFEVSYNGSVRSLAVNSAGNVYMYALGTGIVYSNSGVLTSTNPSDSRLKDNITDISWGLAQINQLRPVSYNWKNDQANQGTQYGFIAQEVQSVMPELVKTFKGEDDVEYLGLDKEGIYATLVKAIQELKAEVDSLKQQLGK